MSQARAIPPIYRLAAPAPSSLPQEQEREDDPLLTVPEVAQFLRVDISTVRRWIGRSQLSAVSLPCTGKRQVYRVKRSSVARLLQSQQREEGSA